MQPAASYDQTPMHGHEDYESPRMASLGPVTTTTLGSGGSSMDGNFSVNQRGRGNDGRGPHGTKPNKKR